MPRSAPPVAATPGRIVAHRGASRVAPENTLAAFAAAARQGVDWVEFDICLLGDGTAVVHHDATLERTTDAVGPLGALGRADLAGIDAGSWFAAGFAGEKLPTLDAALDFLGRAGLAGNLEMKPHGAPPGPLAAAVAAALAARPWMRDRILVSSFSAAALAELRAAAPGLALALLVETAPADWPAQVEALGAAALHVGLAGLEPALLAAAHARGVDLRVYTVNDPGRLAGLRVPGLTGVITDDPPAFLGDPGWAAWARR